jgi:hypothetical protein
MAVIRSGDTVASGYPVPYRECSNVPTVPTYFYIKVLTRGGEGRHEAQYRKLLERLERLEQVGTERSKWTLSQWLANGSRTASVYCPKCSNVPTVPTYFYFKVLTRGGEGRRRAQYRKLLEQLARLARWHGGWNA